jgi:hypothetical protein
MGYLDRNETFVFAIVVVSLMLGGVSLAFSRGDRDNPSLRNWGVGLLLYAAGILVVVAGGVWSRPLSSLAGNCVIALAAAFSVRGVLAQTRFRVRLPWLLAPVAPVAVLLIVNGLGTDRRPLVDLVAPTLLAIALFTPAAIALLAGRRRRRQLPATSPR